MAPSFTTHDERATADLERAADPNNKDQQSDTHVYPINKAACLYYCCHQELVTEMKAHLKKLQDLQRTEDPRLSFSTPQFKEAQRAFTENFKKNFNRPIEWALVQDYPWSTPQLRKVASEQSK